MTSISRVARHLYAPRGPTAISSHTRTNSQPCEHVYSERSCSVHFSAILQLGQGSSRLSLSSRRALYPSCGHLASTEQPLLGTDANGAKHRTTYSKVSYMYINGNPVLHSDTSMFVSRRCSELPCDRYDQWRRNAVGFNERVNTLSANVHFVENPLIGSDYFKRETSLPQ